MSHVANRRIEHGGIGVSDLGAAARFYDAALGALGLQPPVRITKSFGPATGSDEPNLGGIGYGAAHPIFWIDLFHPAKARQHTAFRAIGPTEVDTFFKCALEAAGQDNGAPGAPHAAP